MSPSPMYRAIYRQWLMLTISGQLMWASSGHCQIQHTGLEGMVCPTNRPQTCQITMQYKFLGQCSVFPSLTWKGKSGTRLSWTSWFPPMTWAFLLSYLRIASTRDTKIDKYSTGLTALKIIQMSQLASFWPFWYQDLRVDWERTSALVSTITPPHSSRPQ